VEPVHPVHHGGAEEAAVEAVGPGVVGALDRAGQPAARLLAQARAAVPADVEERPHRAAAVAQDDDALLPDGPDAEVARLGRLLRAAGAEPAAQEEPLLLLPEALGRGVEAPGQGRRAAGANLRRLEETRHSQPPDVPADAPPRFDYHRK